MSYYIIEFSSILMKIYNLSFVYVFELLKKDKSTGCNYKTRSQMSLNVFVLKFYHVTNDSFPSSKVNECVGVTSGANWLQRQAGFSSLIIFGVIRKLLAFNSLGACACMNLVELHGRKLVISLIRWPHP